MFIAILFSSFRNIDSKTEFYEISGILRYLYSPANRMVLIILLIFLKTLTQNSKLFSSVSLIKRSNYGIIERKMIIKHCLKVMMNVIFISVVLFVGSVRNSQLTGAKAVYLRRFFATFNKWSNDIFRE